MREQAVVALIVIMRTVLAIGFSLGPIFEGPDEIEHFRYIYALDTTHRLPDPYAQQRGEYHQAPLYYLLAWPIARVLDGDLGEDFEQIDGRLNPFYGSMIDITGNDNKNLYLHSEREAFPYSHSQLALTVHSLRLFSVLLGALTVAISFFIARLVWPKSPGKRLLAVGLVAFCPQFVFLSSLINNDNLLILLATLTLWVTLIQIRDGVSWRNATYLGILLGALLLTKVSAVFIAVPVAVGFVRGSRPDRRVWRYVLVTLGIMSAISGWWYVYNWVEYGDPTGTKAVLETWPEEVIRPGKLALDVGIERISFAYSSVWARFGHGAVPVSRPLYAFFDGMTGAALLGAVYGGVRQYWSRRKDKIPAVAYLQAVEIATFAAVWTLALLYWASMAWSGNQGRYMLPGVAAWGIIFTFGLQAWLPSRLPARIRDLISLASVGVLAAIAWVSFLVYFKPAYEISSAPQRIEHPLSYVFGEYAELTGISSSNLKAEPGETIVVSLYWRALQPTPSDLLAYVHSVESDLVRRDSYPATGNMLSTEWRPGEAWAEHYHIEIPADAATQQTLTLIAGLYDPREQQAVEAFLAGNPVTPVVGNLSIHAAPEAIQTGGAYCFGDLFVLKPPQVSEDGRQIDLNWQALRETPNDYTLFVHVLDDQGEMVTQADAEPRGGAYPTSAWVRGEVVADRISIPLADTPGEPGWHVAIGLYNPKDFTRLPIRHCDGDPIGDTLILQGP